MNRAQRRAQNIKNKEPIYNLRECDIAKMKQEATDKGVEVAFNLLLAIPVMILHDHYSDITRKVVDGKSREERFADMCLDLYDSYVKGYVTFQDLQQCLYDETGIKINKGGEKNV